MDVSPGQRAKDHFDRIEVATFCCIWPVTAGVQTGESGADLHDTTPGPIYHVGTISLCVASEGQR